MKRHVFRSVLMLALLASTFLSTPDRWVSAATFRNHIAQVPAVPTSAQSVRVWMQSDTAFGETAGIEYNIGSSFLKVLGTFDTSGPSPANWRADIPAQPNGTFVRYQLFTRNQSGQDYGFTGFNWSYTVNDGDIQWDGLKHDSFDSYYRSPFGAVTAGTPVTLRFRTFPFDVEAVSVRVHMYSPATNTTTGPIDYPMTYLEDRVENSLNYAIWTLTLTTPSSPAILYYKFRITDRLDVDWYSDNGADDHDNLGQGGTGQTSDNEPFSAFQLTAYAPSFQTPAWLQNANVYQIFPDRFRNGDISNDYCRDGLTNCPVYYGNPDIVAHTIWNESIHDPRQAGPYFNDYGNQFYGGDLQGIEDKLDYLQSLGIDTLYLTPIFLARSNHRYDTDDYLTVDPALGGDAAFQSLVQAMEQRGMYLILDGVFNHTSSDSLYFDRYHRYSSDGACESLSSTYRSWFNFFNNDAPCGTGDYEGWFGFESLAVLTDNSAAVRDFIYRTSAQNVVKHWYDAGTSGWRFDVADEISHDWWRDFRLYAKSYDSAAPLVGEVWPDASRFLLGEQLDSVMNYRFRKNVLGFARDTAQWNDNDNNGGNTIIALSPSQFDHALRSVREDYPLQATAAMLNLIDSHDTNRALYVLTLLGDSGLTQARERLQLTALFQFTYLGAPMVYYGDEAGLDSPSIANGANGPEDDPYNRAPYPWADESGNTDVYGPADASLIAYYSQLAHLRQQSPALRTGSFTTILTGDTTASGTDNDTYAFARSNGGQTAIVALNQGGGSNTASLPVNSYFANGTQLQDALGGTTYTVSGGNVNVTLASRSGVILLPAPASADTTPPAGTINIMPAPTSYGWNNGPVTANLSGSDSGSGVDELRYWLDNGSTTVASGDSASVGVNTDNTTVNLRAIDNAGNGSALASTLVRIDSQAPTISGSATPAPNASGWNNGDVTVAFTCDDALSSVATCEAPVTLTGEGSDLSATGTVTDKAGNTASTTVSGIKIDRTAPTTTANAPGGWNNASVEVVLSAADALSAVNATYHKVDGGLTQTGTTATISGDGAHALEYWSVDDAGNEETAQTVTVNIDGTAPGISFNLDPAPNSSGWNNSAVTVTFECSDTGSDLADCTEPQLVDTEGAGQTVTGTAVDMAGNSTSATASINLDKNSPAIMAAPDRAPNGAGWYNADVTVSFTCSDGLSGIASCPTAQTVGEGSGQTVSGTATDAADNTANANITDLKVDKTTPIITISLTADGNPYAPGTWTNNNVVVTFSCSDALSGVASLTPPVTLGEGADQSTSGTCVDHADNSASVTMSDIDVDTTAPTISGTAAPAPNAANWNNTPVTVTWTCEDALSDIVSCPVPSTISGEGAGLTASASVSDNAGNTASASVSANRDATPPVVVVTGVSNGATYAYGSVPTAACSTTDSLSGVANAAALTITGGNPDGTGTFTATCSGASDHAGNAAGPVSVTYTVTLTFNFSGFFQPVDNMPTLNVVNAGRSVPVKFSLNGNQGLNIFAAGYPVSQTIACSTSAPIDVVEQTVMSNASGLTYDTATDTYTYIWKTERSWGNTCRQLIVRLSDGTDHVALFKFNK